MRKVAKKTRFRGVFKLRLCLNNLNQILNFVVPQPPYDCQKNQQSNNKESIVG